jgi:hypothetical protein
MRHTITLSAKDVRKIAALASRLSEFAGEIEAHANGATAPKRRKRRTKAIAAPPEPVHVPRRRKATEGGAPE